MSPTLLGHKFDLVYQNHHLGTYIISNIVTYNTYILSDFVLISLEIHIF